MEDKIKIQASKKKITVITVCRNALPLLRKTVKSVLSQSYNQIEYIIIDAASKDGTIEWLEMQTDSRLKWISEPDDGIYDAMNKGVRYASGEWVCFMNAGDSFATLDIIDKVFKLVSNSVEVLYGDVISNGKIKKAEPPHNSHRMFFCHQSAFVSIALLKQYPFDLNHPISADFKFFKQALRFHHEFLQLNFPIAIFDTTGISNAHRSQGLWDNIRIVWEMDSFTERLRLLPHLLFPYIICKIRGK